MSTPEIVLAVASLVLGSSAVSAILTAWLGRKKTAAETDSISVATMQTVVERLDTELTATREELRETRAELRATQAQLTATTDQLTEILSARAGCSTWPACGLTPTDR